MTASPTSDLRAFVSRIADQRLQSECDEDMDDYTDYEGAYEQIVTEARALLARLEAGPAEPSAVGAIASFWHQRCDDLGDAEFVKIPVDNLRVLCEVVKAAPGPAAEKPRDTTEGEYRFLPEAVAWVALWGGSSRLAQEAMLDELLRKWPAPTRDTSGWREIASAPRDGTIIELIVDECEMPLCRHNPANRCWEQYNSVHGQWGRFISRPTYWRPRTILVPVEHLATALCEEFSRVDCLWPKCACDKAGDKRAGYERAAAYILDHVTRLTSLPPPPQGQTP